MHLADIDRKLANQAYLTWGNKRSRIKFQFPPKLTNDTSAATNKEFEQSSNDPSLAYFTSKARVWSLEWQYIVGCDGWTAADIKTQLICLRKYFYQPGNYTILEKTAFIVLWNLGDAKHPMTFLIDSADITHGKPVIAGDGERFDKESEFIAFPLLTNVKLGVKHHVNVDKMCAVPGVTALGEKKEQWF